MDASTLSSHEISCDACGYPRRGLPDGAACPECGDAPPELVDIGLGDRLDVRGVMERLIVTRGRLNWLRTTALGLALLLYTSYCALRVTLVMSIGQLSLPAVNFPGPKLGIAAMIQRSLGGAPGPWGVDGMMAVLGGVASIWLLTRRQNRSDEYEAFFSIRRAVRWVSVLSVGMMFGFLVSGGPVFKIPGWQSAGWLLMGLAGELLVNVLLYLHLFRMASAVGDQRALACFRVARWLVPTIIGGAGLLAGFMIFGLGLPEWFKDPPAVARALVVLMGIYGAIALVGGAIATAGVGSLLATVAREAFGGWAFKARGAVHDSSATIRALARRLRAIPARWLLVAGIGLWLWVLPSIVEEAMKYTDHNGMAGRLPVLNFPGPKVQVFPIASALTSYSSVSVGPITLRAWEILALWLITVPGITGLGTGANRMRSAARWCPILLAGAAVGAALSLRAGDYLGFTAPSRAMALFLCFFEAPATALVYLHLANLASIYASRPLARKLRMLATAAGSMALVPVIGAAISRYTQPYHYSPTIGLICAAYGALVLAVACLAVVAMLQLAWAAATHRDEFPATAIDRQ